MNTSRGHGRRALPFAVALALLGVTLAGPAATAGPEGSGTAECARVEDHPILGPACRMDDGWLVILRDGTAVPTHGPDPAAPFEHDLDAMALPPPADPECTADPATDYFMHVIYARAHNVADQYASRVTPMRDAVRQMTGLMLHESGSQGLAAKYKVHCTGGAITVENAVLPTDEASATFASIASDLQALGYNNNREKYLVYYEGTRAGVAGTGHRYDDDSRIVDNWNNGRSTAVPMFAVSFGYMSFRVFMHENGHNMGAVQTSSPHTSGAGHCNDGLDIMCYSDGGYSSAYDPNVCQPDYRFDCNADDYFNTKPPAGSYLDTHWNVGWTQNRFLKFGSNDAPVMTALSCAPDPVDANAPASCSFTATDGSTGIHYTVDWGDGSPTTRVPASGHVAPGTTGSASHAWSTGGTKTVSVTATDDDPDFPITSPPLAVTVGVNEPPCDWSVDGRLTAGLLGLQLEGQTTRTHTGVPLGCPGSPFTLTGSGGNFDVCWLDAAGQSIRCDRNGAGESGTVPAGAASARVIFQTGFLGQYTLTAG